MSEKPHLDQLAAEDRSFVEQLATLRKISVQECFQALIAEKVPFSGHSLSDYTRIEDGRFTIINLDLFKNWVNWELIGLPSKTRKTDSLLKNLDFGRLPGIRKIITRGVKSGGFRFDSLPTLEHLECSLCDLKELDVRGLPALRHLECEGNSLTRLDLSQNPLLEVCCCGANQIEQLDLSRNPALKKLTCLNNGFKNLDLSHTPELVHLGMDANKAEPEFLESTPNLEYLRISPPKSMNLSRLTSLHTLLLCDYELMDGLDIRRNTNLEKLSVDSANLEVLDISKNLKLKSFNWTAYGDKHLKTITCTERQAVIFEKLRKQCSFDYTPEQQEVIDLMELESTIDDFSKARFKKAVNSPECDLGTAIRVYWAQQPQYYLKYRKTSEIESSSEIESFRLIQRIESNVAKGMYKHRQIPCDPSRVFMELSPADEKLCVRSIPQEMYYYKDTPPEVPGFSHDKIMQISTAPKPKKKPARKPKAAPARPVKRTTKAGSTENRSPKSAAAGYGKLTPAESYADTIDYCQQLLNQGRLEEILRIFKFGELMNQNHDRPDLLQADAEVAFETLKRCLVSGKISSFWSARNRLWQIGKLLKENKQISRMVSESFVWLGKWKLVECRRLETEFGQGRKVFDHINIGLGIITAYYTEKHYAAVKSPDNDYVFQYLKFLPNTALIIAFDLGEIREGVQMADLVQEIAPLNSHIYHSAACLYVADSQLDKALEQVELAKMHKYPYMEKIRTDQDLAPLFDHDRFKRLF